jgi:hypothetical protein
MMPTLSEGKLTFTLPDDWQATKYDEWSHYRNQAISICGGSKAIEILALEPKAACWLIEVKDYREHPRSNTIELAEVVAIKVRDTLATLVGAQHTAADSDERAISQKSLRARSLRVVLHLEQPDKPSRLFPRAINPANVRQRLKQLLKPIDPHPRVVEMNTQQGIPWKVTSP